MPTNGWRLMENHLMTLRHRTTTRALTSLIRLAWSTAEAARRLAEAGVHVENWVDRTAARHGIDILEVLAPLTEGHSAAKEA
jgi:hypothetical protein